MNQNTDCLKEAYFKYNNLYCSKVYKIYLYCLKVYKIIEKSYIMQMLIKWKQKLLY